MANSIWLTPSWSVSAAGVAFTVPALLPDGVLAAPALSFAAAPGTGIYRVGANTIGFVPSGSTAVISMDLVTLGLPSSTAVAWTNNATVGYTGQDTFLIRGGGAALLNFGNSVTPTVGVGFDFATNAVLKLRTLAQTGYATLDVLGLKASGAAGANFGPAGIVSITVVNGIVTAAS